MDSKTNYEVANEANQSQGSIQVDILANTYSAPAQSQADSYSKERDYLKSIGMDPSRFWPKKYRFTREKPTGYYNPMSIGQRNFYEANGYIIFDDCVNKKLLESIRAQHRSSSVVDEMLMDKLLFSNEMLLKYVKCFCDEQIMLMTHQLLDSFQLDQNIKMREAIDNCQQQRRLLLRDWMYLPFRPIDRVCCAVVALEPMEHVLLVVPGTHRIGQCSIDSSVAANSAATSGPTSSGVNQHSRELFENTPERLSTLVDRSSKGFKYIDLKPGQTLFYHPGLVHGFSDDLINFHKQQLAAFAYYAAANCEYVDLRQTVELDQTDGKQDQRLLPLGLAHFRHIGNPVDYTTWLDKPRLIADRRQGPKF